MKKTEIMKKNTVFLNTFAFLEHNPRFLGKMKEIVTNFLNTFAVLEHNCNFFGSSYFTCKWEGVQKEV